MNGSSQDQLQAFVRSLVSELFPDIPDVQDQDYGDPISLVAGHSRKLASTALGDSEYASDVCDAVVLYAFAVSAVRWRECPLSECDLMFAGRLLGEMATRTGAASKRVSAIADQLRLAPYRAKEIQHIREHVRPDGSVDFAGWEAVSRDPPMVRFLASLA